LTTWAGVDVGGPRKGFDLAIVDDASLVAGPIRITAIAGAVSWLAQRSPSVIAVDSPRQAAPPDSRSRDCERELATKVCGIRYTPDAATMRAHHSGYYDWVLNGLKLYAALNGAGADAGWSVIECFPTASMTRLGGPRRKASRGRWSREVLAELGVRELPRRMNQDARDALVAAVTARLYDRGETECFGEIIVPSSSSQ
jgi:predicted nuclease with RNAse H fold